MKNTWRSFCALRSLSRIPSSSVHLRPIAGSKFNLPSTLPQPQNPSFCAPFQSQNRPFPTTITRLYSSLLAVDQKSTGESKSAGLDAIKLELASLDPKVIDLIIQELGSLDQVRNDGLLRLDSRAYNRMLSVLGKNGELEGFWGLVKIMRKKGFAISKSTYTDVLKSFEEAELETEFAQLEKTYLDQFWRSEFGRDCRLICDILKNESDARGKLSDAGIVLSDDLVVAVLDKFCDDHSKALLFFHFVREKYFCGSKVYNAMARVLAREDCISELWDVIRESRSKGYELEKKTYVKVSEMFCKSELIAEAVNFFEFAMGCLAKPSNQDFKFLMKMIVTCKELDLKLITRVVRAFTNDGNVTGRSVFIGLLESLRSVGRLSLCDEVLKAMEEGGFAADSAVHDHVVIGLSKAGKMDRALEYLDNIENEGYSLDSRTWTSLVKKFSSSGELQLALICLNKMIERKGVKNVAPSLEVLANGLRHKDKVKKLHKILKDMITKKNVQPSHSTYKVAIKSLVTAGYLKEASDFLPLMKKHKFPPFIDPFIEFISKSGSVDDAMGFLKAMTVKEFPSRTVFLRVFETLLKAGRHDIAHGVLSRSPGSVRNHADVLELFYSMKAGDITVAVA